MSNTNFKPTISKPVSDLAKGADKTFNKTMEKNNVVLNETDELLREEEKILKKKIFDLAKMEALVFSDPKLSAEYQKMNDLQDRTYLFGYHANETILNHLFNEWVLGSAKYLQKYKQAIPSKKKTRRDASGINQLKKAGIKDMEKKGLKPLENDKSDKSVEETTGAGSSGGFSAPMGYEKQIDETTSAGSAGGAAGYVGYAGPAAWGGGDLMKGKKGKAATIPIIKGATFIQESNYLTDPSGFEKYVSILNEEENFSYKKFGDEYKRTHPNSNNGLGITSQPNPSPERNKKTETIEDNTALYISQDIDNMPKKDVDMLHNDMTEPNSYFPHPNNKNLKDDGIQGSLKEDSEVEVKDIDFIKKNTDEYGDLNNNSKNNLNIMKNDIETKELDKPDLKTEGLDEKAVSKKQQKFMGMVHAVQKGELSPSKVGGKVEKAAETMKPKDVKDFAATKTKDLPLKVDEDTQTMIQSDGMSMSNKATPTGEQSNNMDMGMRNSGGGGMNESDTLLEELNNELKAFSIYHDKLKIMSEDRKPSSLILKDRLGSENQKNFKKDLKDSSVSKLVDIENELEYKDQQTEVKDPQKLGADIEKKSLDKTKGQALKNVGDSDNNKGDEITKRNMTKDEQDTVNNYRLGLGDFVFDNKPSQKFEDRMKADMGDKLYQQRQDKLAFRSKAPMYNKDSQPIEKSEIKKNQFDKEKSGFNDTKGLNESEVTGKYYDKYGKKKFIDFKLNEVKSTDIKELENLSEINLDGLGNSYTSKHDINESVIKAMNENKFYTNGIEVFVVKNVKQTLVESDNKIKKPINEEFNKMKHLLNYNPENFTNTKNNTRI